MHRRQQSNEFQIEGFALTTHKTIGRKVHYDVRTYPAFEALPPDYRRLFNDMAQLNFSFSLPWFVTLAQTALEDGATLRLYGVESSDPEPRAHALLVAQTPAARRGAVMRKRHIGRASLSGLTGYQTYLYAPLLREDHPHYNNILDNLARHLRSERPKWELLEFSAMDTEAPSYRGLMEALQRAGYLVRSYPHFLAMFESTQGQDYAAYTAQRPPSARKQIRNYERKERKLSERNSFKYDLFTTEEGLDRALQDYAAVLEASWKEPDHHPAFLPACIRAAAQAGALRLGIVYLDGRPAATQLVFLAGRRALFYRTAYDPAFAKESAGALVKLRMVQHLLDEDAAVDEFDFGRDRETFKKIWASGERTRGGIIAFDRRTLGGWRGFIEHRAFELRDRLGEASRPLRSSLATLRRERHGQQPGH